MSKQPSTKPPKPGTLYLLPVGLGESSLTHILPTSVKTCVEKIDYYIAEREKTARHFIKKLTPEKTQSKLHFNLLNKRTKLGDLPSFLVPCLNGSDIGLLSEAGCPGIADPGAAIVSLAHQKKIKVVPLVGPSSITLSMMASGLNGQNFAFNGYLPIDKNERKHKIKLLERRSFEEQQAQIFIETPYRNDKLLTDLKRNLQAQTKLCVAREITTPTEYIKTLPISQWQKEKVNLHKKPTIFIIQKEM